MKKKMCVIMILVLITSNLVGCSNRSKETVSAGKNDISGTIRISTSSSHRFLEEAAQKFETLHPSIKVEIDAYITPKMMKQNNPEDIGENYINTINTELMSGKGADIIYINGLPYRKYVYRKIFADLNQLMKSDPNYDASKYYTNVFDAVELNNGLYTLPIEYGYQLLASETKINANDSLWNWQEFFSAAQNELNGEDKYIMPVSDNDLFYTIFRQNYSHFVDEEKKTASFNSKEFVSLLKQCKSLADKNQIAKSSENISEKAGKQALFQYQDIFTVDSFASSQMNLYRLPSDDKGNIYFETTMLAINNASPNKNAAWEFLKFVISDEMQSSPYLGISVNRSAFKEKSAKQIEQFYQNESINLSKNKKTELMQKYTSFNESIANDLKIDPYPDRQINKLVKTEANSFFVGRASAEDVAQIIQNKVNIYLKE